MPRRIITVLGAFLLLSWSPGTAGTAEAKSRALLVGIANYSRDEVADLRGPLNDVALMKNLLEEVYHFDHITTLTDAQATREGILRALGEELRAPGGPDDLLVFYYAGHGSQVDDRSGDEADGKDEVLAPYDIVPKGGANLILDDELGEILGSTRKQIVMVVDACHSGDLYRAFRGGGDGNLGPAQAVGWRYLPITDYSPASADRGPSQSDLPEGVIFLSASGEKQKASEQGFQGQFHGAFTFMLVSSLEERRDQSYSGLVSGIRGMLARRNLSQVPELATNPDSDKALASQTVFAPIRKTNDLQPKPGPTAAPAAERSSEPVQFPAPVGTAPPASYLPQYGESHALVIGASDYAIWPRLPGVKEDVKEVAAMLACQGFAVETVLDPSAVALAAAFSGFIARHGRQPESRLLFWFAGHGYTEFKSYGREMGYLIPVDAPRPENELFLTKALSLDRFEEYAKNINANHSLFVFDSCFSGQIFTLYRDLPARGIGPTTALPVRQFISSGSADEKVPDRSEFRELFNNAISGAADGNRDGYVTGRELGEYLTRVVPEYTRQLQHPQSGTIRDFRLDKGDFVFRVCADCAPPPADGDNQKPSPEKRRLLSTGVGLSYLRFNPHLPRDLKDHETHTLDQPFMSGSAGTTDLASVSVIFLDLSVKREWEISPDWSWGVQYTLKIPASASGRAEKQNENDNRPPTSGSFIYTEVSGFKPAHEVGVSLLRSWPSGPVTYSLGAGLQVSHWATSFEKGWHRGGADEKALAADASGWGFSPLAVGSISLSGIDLSLSAAYCAINLDYGTAALGSAVADGWEIGAAAAYRW
ncbi:MAG: caspase family protein [Acidobacteria bacterium]|nr:caspase family protein [Acidobacteriota bacterium]